MAGKPADWLGTDQALATWLVVQQVVQIPSRVVVRAGVRIREVAHIREAAGSKAPNSANTCGHMDRDGNPADKPRTRSARALREAGRCNCKCARTWKDPRPTTLFYHNGGKPQIELVTACKDQDPNFGNGSGGKSTAVGTACSTDLSVK